MPSSASVLTPPPTESRLWIAASVLRSLDAEATDRTPNETGGILLGYWSAAGREAVVSDWIGPGPRARHARTSFIPDHEYQEAELARRYARSGRMLSYLGDWHTHPKGAPTLSARDIRTLRRIATTAEAGAPTPVMVVLAGGNPWIPSAWIGHIAPTATHRFAWWRSSHLTVEEALVKIFQPLPE
jgi:integrative and conjugative element protein (TIGR02256 family)